MLSFFAPIDFHEYQLTLIWTASETHCSKQPRKSDNPLQWCHLTWVVYYSEFPTTRATTTDQCVQVHLLVHRTLTEDPKGVYNKNTTSHEEGRGLTGFPRVLSAVATAEP